MTDRLDIAGLLIDIDGVLTVSWQPIDGELVLAGQEGQAQGAVHLQHDRRPDGQGASA